MGDDNLVAALQRELDTKKHELTLKQAELDAFRVSTWPISPRQHKPGT